MKNLPDKQYLVNKVGKKKDLPKLKKTSAEVISLYADDGVDFGGGGTSDFNKLDNRPKYKGQPMTGDTDIMGGGAISGHGIPTKDTEGTLGQTYIDLDTNKLYVLDEIENNIYYWSEIVSTRVVDITKYGELDYYSVWEASCSLQSADNVTLERVDMEKFKQWVADNPGAISEWEQTVNFDYNNEEGGNFWQVLARPEQIIIPADEIYETTGLDLVVTDPSQEWASCSVEEAVNVDKTSEILTVDIIGGQLKSLGNSTALADITGLGENGDVTVNKQAISAFWYTSELSEFPDYFLCKCKNLEKIGDVSRTNPGYIWIHPGIIGDYFLAECPSLKQSTSNSEFTISVDKIGNCCLDRCFVETIDSNIATFVISANIIGDALFYNNRLFTGIVSLSCKESLGHSCLAYCSGVSTVRISNPDAFVKEIKHNFLLDCSSMTRIERAANAYVDFSNLVEVGDGFLAGCNSLTQEFKFLSLKKVGKRFLADASVNMVLSFPSLEEVGEHFMSNCSRYNRRLKFPSLKKIGSHFMYNCKMFRNGGSKLEFPNLLILSIASFMYDIGGLVNGLHFGQSDLTIAETYTDKNALSADSQTSDLYRIGVTITGPGRSQVISKIPNRTSRPYRKILDGGE